MNKDFIIDQNRIYLPNKDWNILAEIAFEKINDNTYDIYHTFVDESMRWQGIADELLQKTIEYITKQWFSITASCPFAKSHLNKTNSKPN